MTINGNCPKHPATYGWHGGNGTTTQRGYGYSWQMTRERILKRDKWLCQVCLKTGRPTPATEVDHIMAKANGGKDDDSNLQAICSACHDEKSLEESKQ